MTASSAMRDEAAGLLEPRGAKTLYTLLPSFFFFSSFLCSPGAGECVRVSATGGAPSRFLAHSRLLQFVVPGFGLSRLRRDNRSGSSYRC